MIAFRKETHSTLQTASRKLHCLLCTLQWHWSIYYFNVTFLIEIKQSSHDFPAPANTFPPTFSARLEASHPSELQSGAREHQVLLPRQQSGPGSAKETCRASIPSWQVLPIQDNNPWKWDWKVFLLHWVCPSSTEPVHKKNTVSKRKPQNQALRWLFNFRFMIFPEPLHHT